MEDYTGYDALGTMGLGLLNSTLGLGMNPYDIFMSSDVLRNLFNRLGENKKQYEPISGFNQNYSLPINPSDDTISRLMRSIGKLESGNKYSSIGVPTRTGDRAFGRYQVMGANIPSWTKEIIGYPMTPRQFLQNPAAQDAVARARLAQYYKKYGNINDAASMWFSGRPMRNNNSRDALGTSVPQYVNTVNRYF